MGYDGDAATPKSQSTDTRPSTRHVAGDAHAARLRRGAQLSTEHGRRSNPATTAVPRSRHAAHVLLALYASTPIATPLRGMLKAMHFHRRGSRLTREASPFIDVTRQHLCLGVRTTASSNDSSTTWSEESACPFEEAPRTWDPLPLLTSHQWSRWCRPQRCRYPPLPPRPRPPPLRSSCPRAAPEQTSRRDR